MWAEMENGAGLAALPCPSAELVQFADPVRKTLLAFLDFFSSGLVCFFS